MKRLKLRGGLVVLMTLLFVGLASAQDLWDGTVATSFSGGSGTEEDPYQIRTGAELMYFVNLVNSGDDFSGRTVKMMNDIDLNQNNFCISQFAGTFDGGGHFLTILFGASTNSSLFNSLTGRVHHLGIVSTIQGQYKGVSYCQISLINVLSEGGVLEDCYYTINGGAEIFYYQATLAFRNSGIIRNCYAGGSFRIYSENNGTVACQLVYTNYATGIIENCYACVNNGKTSQYYGGRDIPLAYEDHGTTIHNSTDVDSLNTWVDEHPDHSRWTDEGSYKLVDFNSQSESTISFVDELFGIEIPSYRVATGSAIGELPTPNADCTFIGWTRFGNIVAPTDIVLGDWTLFSKWEQQIRKQPIQSDMTIEVDDIDHASFQWYAIYGDATYLPDWVPPGISHDSSTSDTVRIQAYEGQILRLHYTVSSEKNCDVFTLSCNGTVILRASGEESDSFSYTIPADGFYTFIFRYSKDDDTSEGLDNVVVTNIRLSNPENQLDCTSSQLPDYLITQNGLYFCNVSYSNTGVVLTSDTVMVNESYLDNVLKIESTKAYKGMLLTLPVNLINYQTIASFEFDLSLPEGVTLQDKPLADRSENHKRTCEQLGDGTWHFAVQSPDGSVFDGNEGIVLYLILDVNDDIPYGDHSIELSDIVFTTADGTEIRTKDVIAIMNISTTGDVNGDGVINVSDITALINYVMTH